MIIGIHGRKQCGKDSMAGFIEKQLSDKKVKRLALAKPLKDLVIQVFNVPPQNVWGSNADKEYPLCTWGEIFTGKACNKYKKRDRDLLSAREILQLIGTDVCRYGRLDYLQTQFEEPIIAFFKQKFGASGRPYPDVWVDLTAMDVKVLKARGELDVGVISDLRFKNEFEMIKRNSGKTIRLYRDTKSVGVTESIVHASERELEEVEDSEFDFVLYEHENTDLKALSNWTTKVLTEIGLLEFGGIAV